jgi:Flp pilus assembly protein TadB
MENSAWERGKRLQSEKTGGRLLRYMEERLRYSGISKRFPWITLEIWILLLLGTSAAGFGLCLIISRHFLLSLGVLILTVGSLLWVENLLCLRNYRAVDRNLMEFLNLLGNYSMSTGEVTHIFHQAGKFLEEPLRSVLEECYYEAQTSGDAEAAMRAMSDKVEHRKFREFIRSIMITARYSADYTIVIDSTRKTLQEHYRGQKERKAMIREAFVNIALLGGMLVVVLLAVEQMIGTSIWDILLHTLVGRGCMGMVIFLFFLFYREAVSMDRE